MLQAIKNIFSDLGLLYKNFLHWNVSKLIIYVLSFLLGLAFALPFLVILGILMYFDPISWSEIITSYATTQTIGLPLLMALYSSAVFLIIEILLAVTAFCCFAFGYSYYIFPLFKVYFGYLNGEKLPYGENIYFNFKSIYKYLGMVSWKALVFLIPIFVFLLGFIISIFSFGGIETIYQNYYNGDDLQMFSIINLIIFLVSFLIMIYLGYRMSFSNLIYLDNKNYSEEKTALDYVKESFKITSGVKIFKFLLLAIIFGVFSLILSKIGEGAEILGNFTSFLFGIVSFLLVSGLFEMYFLGIYKYIMIGAKREELAENEIEKFEQVEIKEEVKEIEKIIEEKPKKSRAKKVEEKVPEKPKRTRKTKTGLEK